jgi:type IV secretion system protein VirD4
MCAEAPVSVYVQVAPADASALKPLVRLFAGEIFPRQAFERLTSRQCAIADAGPERCEGIGHALARWSRIC